MKPVRLVALAALTLIFTSQVFAALEAPEARGRLSLAWEEFDSGRCREALKYVAEVDKVTGAEGVKVMEDVVWLKVECLRQTGGYPAAAALLEEKASEGYEWLHDFWQLLMVEWAEEASRREAYDETLVILKRASALFPETPLFDASARTAAYRAEVSRLVAEGKEGRLGGGGDLKISPPGRPLQGAGWVAACPAGDEPWWIEWYDCVNWMPGAAKKLEERKLAAWIRLDPDDCRTAITFEAGQLGMGVDFKGGRTVFSRGGFTHSTDTETEIRRFAIEGMGLRGGSLLLAAEADRSIRLQEEMAGWIRRHSDDVSMRMDGQVVTIKHLRSGREFFLHLPEWAGMFASDRNGWEKLWGELVGELGSAKRPFRCFCGREVVLREMLVNDREGFVSSWRGDGVAAALLAVCPEHWSLVTAKLLKNWGIGEKEALERAARQAVDTAWDVRFERGRAGESDYVVLCGTAVSSIVRRPGLLLGLLQAVDGDGFSGETVKVWTPLPDALVVGRGEAAPEAAAAGARKAMRMLGDPAFTREPMNYSATVQLPKRPEGTFNLTSGGRR